LNQYDSRALAVAPSGFRTFSRRVITSGPDTFDHSQPQREAALRGARDDRTQVLVATDMRAGPHVGSVSRHQLHDAHSSKITSIALAEQAELVTRDDDHDRDAVDELSMRAIERLTGQPVKREVLPGFGGSRITTTSSKRPTAPPMRSSAFTRTFRPRRASR
jgi:hypothetical protein